jgi:rubrerythrin
MAGHLSVLFETSVGFEKNIAELYLRFSAMFDDDREFWWKLSLEEQNHSALFRSFLERFLPAKLFPDDILDPDIERLAAADTHVLAAIERLAANPPSPIDACRMAIEIEEMSGERFFQEAMVKESSSEALALVQRINNEDKNHAIRIRERMKEKGFDA